MSDQCVDRVFESENDIRKIAVKAGLFELPDRIRVNGPKNYILVNEPAKKEYDKVIEKSGSKTGADYIRRLCSKCSLSM